MEQIRDLESEILQVEEVDESSDDEELRCLSIYGNLVKFLYMRFDFALFFFSSSVSCYLLLACMRSDVCMFEYESCFLCLGFRDLELRARGRNPNFCFTDLSHVSSGNPIF